MAAIHSGDADLSMIQDREVAVIGFGAEARAHCLNLRDSGVDVRVGLAPSSSGIPAAQAVVDDAGSLGLVLGGSGNGEQIAANKVTGIRAALAYNTEIARLAREHNDANVLSLGGRMQSHEEAWQMVEVFLTTEFTGEERHQRRIDELTTWEQTGRL